MLLAAQSMAVGTVMVRWVSKYSDPIMATGWVRHITTLLMFIIFRSGFLRSLSRTSGCIIKLYSAIKFVLFHLLQNVVV